LTLNAFTGSPSTAKAACNRNSAALARSWPDGRGAFLPSLTRSSGAVVNVVSVGALAAVPVLPAYSASKAATFSVTQSLRALLAGRGVQVHAVLSGPIDTDMVRDLPIPKTTPECVAIGIFDGFE
jgi:NAD(P)-dependent dehydrogenase (short-subunit alcohol dehydrogenase family)